MEESGSVTPGIEGISGGRLIAWAEPANTAAKSALECMVENDEDDVERGQRWVETALEIDELIG